MNWLAIPNGFWIALGYAGGVLAFVAGMLVVRAVRGRPVGWQPVCRRCKHDLRGVDPGKGTCPECGADLTRSGAVRTGGRVRRAGAIVVALIAVAVAGTTLWWLTPARIYQLRSDLAASMPLEMLVDTAMSGLHDTQTENMARSGIDALLGTRSGFPQQGLTRKVASGELLDALLKVIARSNEPGRTPVGALLERQPNSFFSSLDDAERARLRDLAVDEIVASGAKKLDLARAFIASAGVTGQIDGAVNELIGRLQQTDAGRAALQPQLVVIGQGTVGGVITLDLQGPLDGLRQFKRVGFERRQDALLIERVEARAANAPQDAQPQQLRPMDSGAEPSFGNDLEVPGLLADLPAGAHQIRVVGVVLPQSLVPKRRSFDGRTTTALTAEEAAKLESARPIDQTLSVMVMPVQPAPPPLERTTDPQAVEAGAKWLAQCRVLSTGSSFMIDHQSLSSENGSAAFAYDFQFSISVRQAEKVYSVGSLMRSGGGSASTGGNFPFSFAATQPFELVFDPSESPEISSGGRTGRPNAVVWARYTLRFANASATPEVASEVLPDAPIVATPLSREEAEKVLQESLGKTGGSRSMRQRPGLPQRSQIDIRFGGVARGGEKADDEAGAVPLVLSGMFELRADDGLLAPISPWVVPLGSKGSTVVFAVPSQTTELYPRTLRYTPSEAHGLAKILRSFRYIAEPFEVRYIDASTPPEIVWLQD